MTKIGALGEKLEKRLARQKKVKKETTRNRGRRK